MQETSSFGRKWQALEKQFKASMKIWRKPSPAFVSKIERLQKPKQAFQAVYKVNIGTVQADAGKRQKAGSSWAKSTMPQREQPKARTDFMYNVHEPRASAHKQFSHGFKSVSPRFDDPKLFPAQERLGIDPLTGKVVKGKPLASYRSAIPRLPNARAPVSVQLDYSPTRHTIEHSTGRKEKAKMAWCKSTVPQREKPVRKIDKFYDPVHFSPRKYGDAAAFASHTPRLLSVESDVPPVGKYTSPFISVGMTVGTPR